MSAFQKQSSGSSWGVWICLVSFYGGAKDFISTCVFLRRITFFIKIEMFWHRIFSIFQKQPPEVFLKILQNSQENNCARFSLLMKLLVSGLLVSGLRPAGLWSQACNFIKRENLEQVFSCEFCEAFKNSFLQNTSGRLLLIFLLDHKLILKSDYAFNNS